jgi:hypothetical protein
MRNLKKSEECIGKYSTKKKASQIAKSETSRTGRKHIPFLTHFYSISESKDIICWTIKLEKP